MKAGAPVSLVALAALLLAVSPWASTEAHEEAETACTGDAQPGLSQNAQSLLILEPHRRGRGTADHPGPRSLDNAGIPEDLPADEDLPFEHRITIPFNCTNIDVDKILAITSAGSGPVFQGGFADGGRCVFVMQGSREQVEDRLAQYSWPSEPLVEGYLPRSS
mmetsp:Transcript_95124/g.188444  ORF Transcript_95124/g.188444 Transcript_95124/m.188444 type:complete len:163 (+) Transcript_95124:94-582(+)